MSTSRAGDLTQLLSQFEPIALQEASAAGLSDRLETKYVLPVEQLHDFLTALLPHYRLLWANDVALQQYATQYYDTAGLGMYFDHHNRRARRVKIRQRTYVQSQQSFLEIKSKKGRRSGKRRMALPAGNNGWSHEAQAFIAGATPYSLQQLQPSLSIRYKRLTFINNAGGERLTIDLDTEFLKSDAAIKLTTFAIVEVKRQARQSSPVLAELKHRQLRPAPFSKYCLGINLFYPSLKKNNFRQKLIQLTRLAHEPTINALAGI